MYENNEAVSTPFTVASFFGGVGGIDLGFENTKKFSTVYINEFDKNAQETISINFPNVKLDRRDIHSVNVNEVPKTDIIVGGFPCQAFSIAGYRKGFEDERGDLFFELTKIISHHKPKVIFIENVKNMVTHDHGNTFKVIRETLVTKGYFIKWKVLNSKDYGNVPQNRERIYIVGFRSKEAFDNFSFPEPIELTNTLKSVIDFDNQSEETKDVKYYYQKGVQPFYDKLVDEIKSQNSIYQWRRQYVRENKSGVVPTLTANMGTGGHNVPLILSNNGIRKLTPRETFNVQGFPKDFKLPAISNGQLYKQAGNSVVIPVIQRIAKNIANSLEKISKSEKQYLPEVESNFSLIHVSMKGRFEGESYFIEQFDNLKSAQKYTNSKFLNVISDEEYKQIVKKGKIADFYSLVNISNEDGNKE
ncbi:TPA: DNA cytosine methyltransferase [Enterococcus faecium]